MEFTLNLEENCSRVRDLEILTQSRDQGDAFAAEGFFLEPEVDLVQWEICGINSCGERRWRAAER